jgi:hypothetical protein
MRDARSKDSLPRRRTDVPETVFWANFQEVRFYLLFQPLAIGIDVHHRNGCHGLKSLDELQQH